MVMDLEGLLFQKRTAILQAWSQLLLETYPADASRLMEKEKDRFINPTGYTFRTEMEALYDELLQEADPGRLSASLDEIIRIRAVQDFSPSQAIAFVFLLKKAIQDEFEQEFKELRLLKEWQGFASRVDNLALLAFDTYTKCREDISEIRIHELRAERDRITTVLARIGLMEVKEGQA